MGRCEPRANENDPGLITLPEGIDELGDAVKSEFDVTTKQVCRALQCTRPFVLSHCKHIRHIYVSDYSVLKSVRKSRTLPHKMPGSVPPQAAHARVLP